MLTNHGQHTIRSCDRFMTFDKQLHPLRHASNISNSIGIGRIELAYRSHWLHVHISSSSSSWSAPRTTLSEISFHVQKLSRTGRNETGRKRVICGKEHRARPSEVKGNLIRSGKFIYGPKADAWVRLGRLAMRARQFLNGTMVPVLYMLITGIVLWKGYT